MFVLIEESDRPGLASKGPENAVTDGKAAYDSGHPVQNDMPFRKGHLFILPAMADQRSEPGEGKGKDGTDKAQGEKVVEGLLLDVRAYQKFKS
ncbi:hypothetical protein ACUUL3_04785 [Thiovibrio sp. JS02]